VISKAQYKEYAKRALKYLAKAKIVVSKKERESVEVADFGLQRLDEIGLQLVVYENNERYCAKELVLLPRQTCPEHRHPQINDQTPGKQETFRCRLGEVYLYVEGEPTRRPKAKVPRDKKDTFTVWKEIVLKPGDQYTIPPNTLHWFQGGRNGAVVSEFSSTSRDESDFFTDREIRRITEIAERS
jgi:D-lyxose ketol-isomerase